MPRKLTKPLGPFRTAANTFTRGKERPIEITLYPTCMEIRAIGTREKFHLTYEGMLLFGAAAEVKHRIKRGAI